MVGLKKVMTTLLVFAALSTMFAGVAAAEMNIPEPPGTGGTTKAPRE